VRFFLRNWGHFGSLGAHFLSQQSDFGPWEGTFGQRSRSGIEGSWLGTVPELIWGGLGAQMESIWVYVWNPGGHFWGLTRVFLSFGMKNVIFTKTY